MLSSPPASPLPKYGRNRLRAGRRTKTQPKRVIRANVHGSHHHPHNEKRRHGGSLNRRSSSRSRSSHRDGSRQGKSNDGRRSSSFTRSCPILASVSGPVTENSSSPPPLPRGKAPHRGQLATFCEELLPLLLFSSPTPTRPSAPTLLPPQN